MEILSRSVFSQVLIAFAGGVDALAALERSGNDEQKLVVAVAVRNLTSGDSGVSIAGGQRVASSNRPVYSSYDVREAGKISAFRDQPMYRTSSAPVPSAASVGLSLALVRRGHARRKMPSLPRSPYSSDDSQSGNSFPAVHMRDTRMPAMSTSRRFQKSPLSYPVAVREYDLSSGSESMDVDDDCGSFTFIDVTSHESLSHNRFKTTFYFVQVQVGDSRFVVKRRYNDFKDLHRKVCLPR